MAEREKNQNRAQDFDNGMSFDLYTILLDIKKWIVVILLVSMSVSLMSYIFQGLKYQKSYEATSTFIVTTKGTNNSIYNNLQTTVQLSEKFSTVLNSSILQKLVVKDMGLDYFPGTASAEVIEETNLLVLKVQANSPALAFNLIKAIMKNYGVVSDTLMGDVILDVLEEPQVPTAPINPFNPFKIVQKTFILVFALLIALVAVWSYLKDTIRKSKEVNKKLNTKLLETIYHEKKYKTIQQKLKNWNTKTSILLVNPSTSFKYVETMRKLGRKIKSGMDEKGAKILLVTSVAENEGKSTVAANLALAIAEESDRVLLIDGDLRRPSLHKVFEVEEDKVDQFGEVLVGKKKIDKLTNRIANTNLYLMLNSKTYENSTEIIGEGMLSKVLEHLKTQVDYIIIDTAPMDLVADAEEMLDLVDATVLVCRQHVAATRDINDAIDILNTSNENKLLGCIYNDAFEGFAEKTRNYGYGYGKYNYGGYGQYGNYGKYGAYGKGADREYNAINYVSNKYADQDYIDMNEEAVIEEPVVDFVEEAPVEPSMEEQPKRPVQPKTRNRRKNNNRGNKNGRK